MGKKEYMQANKDWLAAKATEEALENMEELEVVNELLIPALDEVGKKKA